MTTEERNDKETSKIDEIAEYDGTDLNLVLVDKQDRIPIGKVTVSYLIEENSGLISEHSAIPKDFKLSFDRPSFETALNAIYKCILEFEDYIKPKDES